MKSLLLLALTVPALGQVSITLQQADQAALPGSTRSLYASVQGTSNLEVRWASAGGCTFSSQTTNAAPQVVTAPARGGVCTFSNKLPTNENPNFKSPVSCTVTAASAADPSKTASMVIPVCSQAVLLTTFPSSTVLYRGQFAVIQSDLRGSVNTDVAWTITSNPGGAGTLTGGSGNRHAVFSASAPGTYVLTATSLADNSRKASSTIFVTSHAQPAPNADHTEAVDCTPVGSGRTYDVGPAQPLHDLNAVAWSSLRPGDTVRIHNDDPSGSSPTTYHQHIVLPVSGAPGQPIRICGVADAHGIKPILDGQDATTRPDEDWAGGYIEDLGVVALYDGAHKFDPVPDGNAHVILEGLHIRNANETFKFIKKGTSAATPYNPSASCIEVQTGRNITIRGNELDHCSQAVFSNSRTPSGSMLYDLTIQGNYIHDWGRPGNILVHGIYIQTVGIQVQFNYFGVSAAGAASNVIKSRSVMNFLRWNYISQATTTARAFDMVEPQAFACYIFPYDFAFAYHEGGGGSDCITTHGGARGDPFSPDEVTANLEAYHADYIYGNIIDDLGTGLPFVHYAYDQQMDQAPAYHRRAGTLFYFNNTHYSHMNSGEKIIFDPLVPDVGHSYEFPVIESFNNIFSARGPVAFRWSRTFWTKVVVDSNWVLPGSLLPDRSSNDTYQGGASAKEMATCGPYNRCQEGNGHMVWGRGGRAGTEAATLYVGPTPFNTETFLPSPRLRGLATGGPLVIRDQPSNMEYVPATNTIAPRLDQTYLGALD